MDTPVSNRSSNSSLNISQDGIPSLLQNHSNYYKTSHSLTSLTNTPETSLFSYIYDYIYKSFAFGIEPSAILQDISPEDFNPYLNKVSQFSIGNPPPERKCLSSDFTIERCYAEIPKIFFTQEFSVSKFLDESALNQQEIISMYLDMTDVSIFSKISMKWEDLMSTAYGLENLSEEIEGLLLKVKKVNGATKGMQVELIEKYLKIIRLNRRLGNIRKAERKLKLIENIQKAQPSMLKLMNNGEYSSVSQLLAETQENFKSELKGIKCLNEQSASLERTKANLSIQLDQEFKLFALKFIVLNTFDHNEKLTKLLKNNGSLENSFKIFPKETNYEMINELIKNKINSRTLEQSLQVLKVSLAEKILEDTKNLMNLLGVHKTDENSKWVNISHPHFIIILQSLLAVFNSIFQKFVTLATLILRQFSVETGSYIELLKNLSSSIHKSIVKELSEIETSLTNMFFSKVGKIITSRESILLANHTSELRELYELMEKIPGICKNLSIAQSNSLSLLVLNIQKKYLTGFHERKLAEAESILNGETWVKIDVPDEMIKFILERRGEASKIAGIKLESPEIIATGSLLVFYKIIYEYIKISEELQIVLECSLKLMEILKLYNKRTYELIVEAKAVPQRLTKVTSKHLALSVQGLSFILQEMPYIEHRLSFRSKEFSNLILADLASTREDFSSHSIAIYNKLSQIIVIRVEEHCEKAVTEAKWNTMILPSQMEKEYYLRQICTDLISMHSILLTVLNNHQMLEVFNSILRSLSENLLKLYSRIKIDSYISAQRVKNDSQQLLLALREKFSQNLLEPLEDLEDNLQRFIIEHCEAFLTSS